MPPPGTGPGAGAGGGGDAAGTDATISDRTLLAATGKQDASRVTYSPEDPTDWVDDYPPGDTDDALDQLAQRLTDIDASEVSYTPADGGDWPGNDDPEDVGDALDDLASWISGLMATDIGYDPATRGDWDSDTDPGDVDDALDQLASRMKDQEEHTLGSFVLCYPSTSSGGWLNLHPGQGRTGATAKQAIGPMPYGGSILAMWGVVDVNAYTSGDVRFELRVSDGSLVSTVNSMDFGVSAAANGYATSETYAVGAETFNAGQYIIIRRVFVSGVGITTDDMIGGFLVQFDGMY